MLCGLRVAATGDLPSRESWAYRLQLRENQRNQSKSREHVEQSSVEITEIVLCRQSPFPTFPKTMNLKEPESPAGVSFDDLSPDELERFKWMLAWFRDFRYGDAVEDLGKERVEELISDGYVAVPWAEHAEMFRLRWPEALRDLDPSAALVSLPIWFCHALHDLFGPLVASPTARSLQAAREYLREHPVGSKNAPTPSLPHPQSPSGHNLPDTDCETCQPNS
jgi:hypothetical protein